MYVSAVSEGDLSQEPRNLVLRTFGTVPTVSAVMWSVLVFGWIALGTLLLKPLAGSPTEDFVRDGAVRWPGALVVLALLLLLRKRMPIDLLGLPSVPVIFPWASITLVVVALIRLSVVTQFWGDGAYTAATFFSELSTGVFEELAFRGLIFGGLVFGFGRQRSGVRKAAVISTVLFGLVHASAGWAAVVVTLLFGAVFLISTLELRSLWPAAVLHGLFDVGVNGGAAAGAEDWRPTLTGFASVSLLLAGAVAIVVAARWRQWPVQDAPAPTTGSDRDGSDPFEEHYRLD